ncbi:MAG: cyclic lactone autoinducer peptide [Lachnospiraceae bacterium]|nr:cyclic lactone autoinducer peptide [Lachnospiraceae bacterium]
MKSTFEKIVIKYGARLCALAVSVATIAPLCCRGQWYQPKEPDNLDVILKNPKKY